MNSDARPPERMLFIGGHKHGESLVVDPLPYLRLPKPRPFANRVALSGMATIANFETEDYRLMAWVTAAGERLEFYCCGDDARGEGLFRPISNVFDELGMAAPIFLRGRRVPDPLATGFGPNRLFLAVGLWNAWLAFDEAIMCVGRKHGILRKPWR